MHGHASDLCGQECFRTACGLGRQCVRLARLHSRHRRGEGSGLYLKSQLYADCETSARLAVEYPLGPPVYDLATQTDIIGYLTGIGFVPNELVPKYDALRQCSQVLSAELQAMTHGGLTPECKQTLAVQGVIPQLLDGR